MEKIQRRGLDNIEWKKSDESNVKKQERVSIIIKETISSMDRILVGRVSVSQLIYFRLKLFKVKIYSGVKSII